MRIEWIEESKSWMVNSMIIKDEDITAEQRKLFQENCIGNLQSINAILESKAENILID